jgi:hypothetical protein
MATITPTRNRRPLLAPTALPVQAAKAVSALTRSGTTATATCASHGYSVGDWVVIAGADQPDYVGPFQVASVVDANTFTFTLATTPNANAAGTITATKGQAGSIWGDGTTPAGVIAGAGFTPATVGALPTSFGGVVTGRVVNGATGPTVACNMGVYGSPTGATGTWREVQTAAGSTTANAATSLRVLAERPAFVLVVFYGNTGQQVYVDAVADEITNCVTA